MPDTRNYVWLFLQFNPEKLRFKSTQSFLTTSEQQAVCCGDGFVSRGVSAGY